VPDRDASFRRRLNLGCGAFKKPDFLNVDADERFEPDLLLDLDELPYPFESDWFELIEADHVLEHLQDPFSVMAELHRILAAGGALVVRVPHFSRGFTHADHRRGFDVTFPYYFDPRFTPGYTGTTFQLDGVRLTWFAQPYLKRQVLSPGAFRAAKAVGRVLDIVANLSPAACSRLWSFWVGGFEEIEFRFAKPGK
jgi:SAM-dependent methyltransferase